ncbi:hypothetical protein B0H67DRAFT_642001 [Lasiosphaeris hirsuta]|uniref:Uncharacterized protein n=1 Tax=Lasiosphaeris hirsuta TaxID=260670 RepID=A0AA40B0Y9_9PEZI|nr:hypothetical protein B0H67DRAFT_642001 [Lasiosphaeris hirsuta]
MHKALGRPALKRRTCPATYYIKEENTGNRTILAEEAAPIPSTRPFWAGLDPDKPEPLDKVLAALHCFQVAPPSASDAFYFEFTVNREDHYRIDNGFPELQDLAAAISRDPYSPRRLIPFEFDPSTGNLTTMASSLYAAVTNYITHECYRVIANSLESLGQLDKPISQLALAVKLDVCALDEAATFHYAIALHSTAEHKMPACLMVFFNGNHEGASKYAQFITEHPGDTHTVVAIQLGLPGRMDSERRLQRLAQKSFVSVFTIIDGAIKMVVQQEPLSTPGGGVKLWLSDLVKERESLPDEFVRPLNVRVNHHQPNITIPYATILASTIQKYRFWEYRNQGINTAKSTTPSSSIASGSGKRLLSTLAGRLVANRLFDHGGKRQPLSNFAQPSSVRASGHAVKGPAVPDGRQRALGTAFSSGRPPLVMSPARAVMAPWSRLLARFPPKW